MKRLKKTRTLTLFLIGCYLITSGFSPKGDKLDLASVSGNFVVIGFHDNLNSNYYPKNMIAEKMGLGTEILDTLVNNLFLKEISSVKSSRFRFVCPSKDKEYMNLLGQIQYTGADDEKYTDISGVNNASLNLLLNKYNSEYIICFSQYYFKKQEKPFPTMFHIINYTIYNQQKKELIKGKVYTNTFDLVNLDEFESLLKKNAKKYISSIEKELH
ncbi:MAG: hypothetical protein JXA77_08480 [Bacteroidales bacterium]|nr:hypothetical protein [Bacteroidales bacterium]MBN2820966.1 hypothetical protein [Bacteroidales bacterium]